MKVLVVGGGGREHAIIWSLAKSPDVTELFCAPGNGGIAALATCVDIAATDLDGITEFAVKERFDRVFVAPDDPLAMGLVDRLEAAGIAAYGPTAAAAEIESSKVFSKQLMKDNGVPTAAYEVFDDAEKALTYVKTAPLPLVVKADGLALGKGVLIAQTREEAEEAVRSLMTDKKFGDAGNSVLIEECLSGPELTVLAFTDGTTVVPMPGARDHKRARDNDQGKNTGGMGVVAPAYVPTPEEQKQWMDTIFQPTVDALRKMDRPFKGVLYYGLMLTKNGPYVIEYNARFGDPEAQAVLPLLKTDLLKIMEATRNGCLREIDIKWDTRASCCVVMASGGYPDSYQKGYPIEGLDDVQSIVFHAGTRKEKGSIVTSGGRVLGVTALADTLPEAIRVAYEDVRKIRFEGRQYRSDIGRSTLEA